MTGGTKFSKRELKKEIERDLATKAREALAKLKDKIGAARARRRETVSRAVQRCRAARLKVREHQKAERAWVRERLNAEFADERKKLRERCDARKAKIRALARRAEDAALREWDEERRYQRQIQRAEATFKRKSAAAERRSAKERRAESDDAVRANVPAELVHVFEKVKRGVRGSPHSEASRAWIREHGVAECVAALDHEVLDAVEKQVHARDSGRRQVLLLTVELPEERPRVPPRLADVKLRAFFSKTDRQSCRLAPFSL